MPTWDELRLDALKNSGDPEFQQSVELLRSKPRKLLFQFGRAVTYMTFRDPSYRKFLRSSWEEVIDIIYTQLAENHSISKTYRKDDLAPVCHTSLTKVQRRFQQQPCSKLTAVKRVAYARELVKLTDNILLVGDDDLVGVELARAGFKNITVLDIDQGVLDQIGAIAARENLKINLIQHDIRNPPPHLISTTDYQLVFLDPYYSLEGINMFLSAARTLTANSQAPHFFLSVHLLSLMKEGLNGLQTLLDSQGLDAIDFQRSFNLYPIPAKTRGLIALLNKTLVKSKGIKSTNQFKFFTSDAILLKPKQ